MRKVYVCVWILLFTLGKRAAVRTMFVVVGVLFVFALVSLFHVNGSLIHSVEGLWRKCVYREREVTVMSHDVERVTK